MGYFSNLRLLINKKGYERFNELINKNLTEVNLDKSYNVLNESDFVYESKESYYIGWDDIRWYEEEYKVFDKSIKDLKKEQYSFSFFYKGEDISDYEQIDFRGNDNLNLKIATYEATFFDDRSTIKENQLKELDKDLEIN